MASSTVSYGYDFDFLRLDTKPNRKSLILVYFIFYFSSAALIRDIIYKKNQREI